MKWPRLRFSRAIRSYLVDMFMTHPGWREESQHEPFEAWSRFAITFETSAFLMHLRGRKPRSCEDHIVETLLVSSVEDLIGEIGVLDESVMSALQLDIFHPLNGIQEVRELWSYDCEERKHRFYAYMTSDGALVPCNFNQPNYMSSLRRVVRLGGGPRWSLLSGPNSY